MILVDAHVHIHDCFDLGIFLDSAAANFKAEAALAHERKDFEAILLLANSQNVNRFLRLTQYAEEQRQIDSNNGRRWTFHPTRESFSIWAKSDGGQGLLVISGRQIVSEEGLEVLALITEKQFEDGLPFAETIQAVKESGAIPVIPWGFGKWMGERGKTLGNYLRQLNSAGLFLGDNGGRPAFWPYPAHFRLAESKGLKILRGSDPLPLTSETWRVGSFGVAVQESISFEHPGMDLKFILEQRKKPFLRYGNLEHPYRFLRNQLAIRILKTLGS